MTDHEFELLLGRMTNQDHQLTRIEIKLDTVNGKVQQHEKDISFVKRLSYVGTVVASGIWAVYSYFGGK